MSGKVARSCIFKARVFYEKEDTKACWHVKCGGDRPAAGRPVQGPCPRWRQAGRARTCLFHLEKRAVEGHGVPRCPREGGSQPTRGARGRPRLRTGARRMERGCGTHSSVASAGLRPRGAQGALGGVNPQDDLLQKLSRHRVSCSGLGEAIAQRRGGPEAGLSTAKRGPGRSPQGRLYLGWDGPEAHKS